MIVGIGLLLIGLACLWGGRYWLRLRRRIAAWPTVRGLVTDRKAIQPIDRGRTTVPAFRWSPEVRFDYRVGNNDYVGDKIWLPWSWTNSRTKAEAFLATIPDEVDVRYDPEDPATSCLHPPPLATALWYGVPGVILLILGVLWFLVELVRVCC